VLFLDIEIPPSRFYISVSYLGVAYHLAMPVFYSLEISLPVSRL